MFSLVHDTLRHMVWRSLRTAFFIVNLSPLSLISSLMWSVFGLSCFAKVFRQYFMSIFRSWRCRLSVMSFCLNVPPAWSSSISVWFSSGSCYSTFCDFACNPVIVAASELTSDQMDHVCAFLMSPLAHDTVRHMVVAVVVSHGCRNRGLSPHLMLTITFDNAFFFQSALCFFMLVFLVFRTLRHV